MKSAIVLASAGLALAAPPPTRVVRAADATSCTVTAYASISAAVASCTAITLSNIAVPAGSGIDLSKLKQGTTVTFAGKTTFGYKAADYDMITVGGKDITITQASGAVIDGNGGAWWDGQGSNGGKTKPDHFFVVDDVTGTSTIENLHIQNWPTHCFQISGCDGLTIKNLVLDNSAGDAANSASSGLPAAHNTDGFDISSSTNIILSGTTVKNQDDCVAVTSGTGITVTGMTCSGGHGLSIGSVGGKSDNTVENVSFLSSSVTNSQNGCRIKSNSGTTGTISGITYKDITLSGLTTYGIDIQQDYLNGGATGSPTNGVKISNVTFNNVHGTMSKGKDYYILCGSGSCSGFTYTKVAITGGSGDSCNYGSCP